MRPVAVFRFSPTEGPAYFAEWLARRGFASTIVALDEGASVPTGPRAYSGIALMGGPMGVNDALPWIESVCALLRAAVAAQIPVLGHCLGGQLLAKALGAPVTRAPVHEIGWIDVEATDTAAQAEWFGGRPRFTTFQWHYDAFGVPAGREARARQRVQCQPGVRRRRPPRRLAMPHRDDAGPRRDVALDGRLGAAGGIERFRAIRRGHPARSRPTPVRVARARRRRVRALGQGLAHRSHAMRHDPRAARSAHQPDRRRRGRRAAGGRVEGAPRERTRFGRDTDRRRSRGRRHRTHPRRRQRLGYRARRAAARRRPARNLQAHDGRRPGGDRDARLPRRGARVDRRRVPARARFARRRPAACVADRGRRRHRRRHRARRNRRRHDGDRARALLQHAGAPQVPADRGDRVGSLRRGVPPRRARASGRRLHAAAQRPRRAPAARAGAAGARRSTAGRRVRRRRGAGRRAVGAARARRLRGPARVRNSDRPDSTRSSTAASSATACSRTRCARRIATCSITSASRPSRCGSCSIRVRSTSTSTRRRSRCASAIRARCTSSCAARSSARWP